MSLKLPDPFVGRRDEKAITSGWPRSGARSTICSRTAGRPGAVDEVRARHEAETRRMWLPKEKRTKLYVDRKKASQSFFGALSLTTKKMRIYPIQGNQNAEQTRPHERVAWRARPTRERRSQSSWATPGSTTPRP